MVTHTEGFGVFGKASLISINVQTQKDWVGAATIYWWATLALGWVLSHDRPITSEKAPISQFMRGFAPPNWQRPPAPILCCSTFSITVEFRGAPTHKLRPVILFISGHPMATLLVRGG